MMAGELLALTGEEPRMEGVMLRNLGPPVYSIGSLSSDSRKLMVAGGVCVVVRFEGERDGRSPYLAIRDVWEVRQQQVGR